MGMGACKPSTSVCTSKFAVSKNASITALLALLMCVCWVCAQSMRAADIRPDHISYSTLIAGAHTHHLLHPALMLQLPFYYPFFWQDSRGPQLTE